MPATPDWAEPDWEKGAVTRSWTLNNPPGQKTWLSQPEEKERREESSAVRGEQEQGGNRRYEWVRRWKRYRIQFYSLKTLGRSMFISISRAPAAVPTEKAKLDMVCKWLPSFFNCKSQMDWTERRIRLIPATHLVLWWFSLDLAA